MVGKESAKTKTDWFMKIMICQCVICAVALAALFLSVRFGGAWGKQFGEDYAKLMQQDFAPDSFSEAFQRVKEYVAAFAIGKSSANQDSALYENTTSSVSQKTDSETESASIVGGGVDLEFTGLDALEGICFERIDVDVNIKEPLDAYELTSGFGYRVSPITGETGIHTGLDMAADYGEPIYAAADGTVVDAAYDASYGNYVKIQHEDNVVTIYAHCSRLCVEEGDEVEQGDKIAGVGSTGSSTGNHLHFEMRKGNIRIDPQYALFG